MGETEIIEKKERKARRLWRHALAAAFIGGLATAFDAALGSLSLGEGFVNALKLTAVIAGIAAVRKVCVFLKDQPLPPLIEEISVTTTVTGTQIKKEDNSL